MNDRKVHCRSAAYYVGMHEGAPRYDIDGTIAGYVTAEEEEYARKLISPSVPGERARLRALKRAMPPEERKKHVYRHYRAFSEE